MIDLSFSDRQSRKGTRQVFLNGQLLRGANALMYEASEVGEIHIPKFTGVTFAGKSVDAIRSCRIEDLFAHLDHLNIRISTKRKTEPSGWGFLTLRIGPDRTKKSNNCEIYIPVDFDADQWNKPYSISELATRVHQALNRVRGNYWFQQHEPDSLMMGFGLFISLPVRASIGDILTRVLPDLEEITNYACGILETKLLGEPLLRTLMQSTFISYGGPDEDFARKIYDSLKKIGVVVFFFPETARLGERIDAEVFRRIQEHDRVLLICSESSLKRPGVTHEIRETLDREARDGGETYLLPITLDNYVFSKFREEHSDLAERLSRRIIGDFRGTQRSRVRFDKAMQRVADALRKNLT
jgi:TIR domain